MTGGWLEVTGTNTVHRAQPPVRWPRLIGGVALVAILVFIGVAAFGLGTARGTAEREAMNDALNVTDVLAEAVLEPALEDALLDPDPERARAARARLDEVVRTRLLSETVIRVKIWTPDGKIVYSDQPELIGSVFALAADEREALRTSSTNAKVGDLSQPENRFEAEDRRKLLEVYRPVETPGKQTLLFETYSLYDVVAARSSHLWRGFAGITLASLLLLLLAQAPLTWVLISRLRRAQAEREAWLAHAVAVSEEERRKIAATLHDGAVQELAASAFLVAGAGDRARAAGDQLSASQLDVAASAVRSGIGSLRSLLVDIYPPALRSAGIAAALPDLVAPLRSRKVTVALDVPEGVELPASIEELIFRVAQECLRNIARHANATRAEVSLRLPMREGDPVTLEIMDDGQGFDPAVVLAAPAQGHFGMRLMAAQADAAGAMLLVRSGIGGTRWRLIVPLR